MALLLRALQPFAKGGNRLCFVHPNNPERCVKVRRPDFSLEKLRRSKGFPKNLRPLSSFDDNAEELRVMQGFQRHYGEEAFRHISHCYGFEETDMGRGLVSELIRDGNGKISLSMKQYLIERGYTIDLEGAIRDFSIFWTSLGLPSRNLLLHNVVVQRDLQDHVIRLVVIDGLGSPNVIPYHWYPRKLQQSRAGRKIADFHRRIDQMLEEIAANKQFSSLGKLLHDGTEP